MGRVPDQHDVFVEPSLAQNTVELEPHGRPAQMPCVGDEPVALQAFRKQLLAQRNRLLRLHLVDSRLEPVAFRGLNNKGGPIAIEAIGM